MKINTLLLILFFSSSSYALVDYSSEEEFVPKNSGSRSAKSSSPKIKRRSPKRRIKKHSGPQSQKNIEVGIQYGGLNVDLDGVSGKASILKVDTHFQTPYDFYLNASYWKASSDDRSLTSLQGSTKGNPEVIVGFNWLEFGSRSEASTVDLLVGLNLGQRGSSFASSRTNKIVGISTAKRFHEFALGLGYELHLSGSPDDLDELEVGNISIIRASLAWRVSSDISFLVEAANYSINEGESVSRIQRLGEKVKFATISPKVALQISPLVSLDLGAHFRSRRLKDGDLIGARLYQYPGAYGTTLFAGLSASL